jgi:EAL domain-containing protein (putative c-di-GMP-specific phosphodiesterase class I)
MIARTLRDSGVEPSRLELEITETMVMSRIECMIERLKAIKALGVTLSIDNFGTGYSNLRYLRNFPLDRLKIDQSFVRDLPDLHAVSIVTAIVGMAHNLGLQVIAAGVESAEQAQFLAGIGCEQSQGCFYCTPLACRIWRGGCDRALSVLRAA